MLHVATVIADSRALASCSEMDNLGDDVKNCSVLTKFSYSKKETSEFLLEKIVLLGK